MLKAQNNVNSIKDIAILEIDELCTYIKKRPKNGGEFTFVWLAVDRGTMISNRVILNTQIN